MTLQDIKDIVVDNHPFKVTLDLLIESWYGLELSRGKSEEEAIDIVYENLGEELRGMEEAGIE